MKRINSKRDLEENKPWLCISPASEPFSENGPVGDPTKIFIASTHLEFSAITWEIT